MLYVLPVKGVLRMLQGRISYLSDISFLMRRDSAEASSTLLACSSGFSDSVGSSIVKQNIYSMT